MGYTYDYYDATLTQSLWNDFITSHTSTFYSYSLDPL